jgi:hypothetical protein
MRWSGDAGANPFAGKLNTFWGIKASTLPVKVDYVGQLAAARESRQKMAHAARLALFARPADTQGYQQVVVDMPLDSSMPTIREVGTWLATQCQVALGVTYFTVVNAQQPWPKDVKQSAK